MVTIVIFDRAVVDIRSQSQNSKLNECSQPTSDPFSRVFPRVMRAIKEDRDCVLTFCCGNWVYVQNVYFLQMSTEERRYHKNWNLIGKIDMRGILDGLDSRVFSDLAESFKNAPIPIERASIRLLSDKKRFRFKMTIPQAESVVAAYFKTHKSLQLGGFIIKYVERRRATAYSRYGGIVVTKDHAPSESTTTAQASSQVDQQNCPAPASNRRKHQGKPHVEWSQMWEREAQRAERRKAKVGQSNDREQSDVSKVKEVVSGAAEQSKVAQSNDREQSEVSKVKEVVSGAAEQSKSSHAARNPLPVYTLRG